MTNARTLNRLIRLAAAGLAGAAALVAPLAATAGAAFEPVPVEVSTLSVQAGTVTSVNGIVTVDAATNSSSDIRVADMHTASNVFTLVRDTRAPLYPGIGCLEMAPSVIRCMPAKHVVVRAGNFNDEVVVAGSWISSDIDGGPGNDFIDSGPSVDSISGGTGRDVIDAGAGSDVLNGGNDADYDRLTGGAGTDDCHAGNYYAECENVLNTRDIPR